MSGAEQFHLDIDVDSLRAAHNGLQRLSEHLVTVAAVTNRVPGDIGKSWTGPAATLMKAELAGLGIQTTGFAPKFHDAAAALKRFADAAETFQTQTLPKYIRAWDSAESDAKTAYNKADRAYDDQVREAKKLADPEATAQASATARSTQGSARGQVASGQRYTMAAMASEFNALKTELGQVAQAAGDAMAGLTVVAVPDSVAKDFIGHRGGGQTFGWCNADGSTFPPDLGTDAALPGMTLVHRKRATQDGERVAESLRGWREHGGEIDPAALAMLQKRQDDPDFASTLLQVLGPDALAALPSELSRIHKAPSFSPDPQGDLVEEAWHTSASAMFNALGVVLAAGTSATGDAALPDTWTPRFLQAARQDHYASVVALVSAAQRFKANIHFGTAFLNQSMNAITDDVSSSGFPRPSAGLGQSIRLALGTVREGASYDSFDVDDPMHAMFQALGDNREASTRWLHQGLPPTSEQTAQGHFLSPRVEFWLRKQPTFGLLGEKGDDEFLSGADNGGALGKVLQAGLTSGGALAHDSAQSTAFFFREMGANRLALPDGAKEGVRGVFVHWVDALNWNAMTQPPNTETMLKVGNNPLTPGSDDTGQPNFYGRDVQWLLEGSFSTNEQVTGYAALSLGHLRQDFNDVAQGVQAGTHSTAQLGQVGGQLGQWQGLLTGQYNDILLTHALKEDEKVLAKKAWASFVIDVLTAPVPGAKAFDGLGSTFAAMATTGVDKGRGALNDSMLDAAFPADAKVNAALGTAVGTADAGYSDGKALLVQWAMENGMIEQRLIDQQWGGHLPPGITVKGPGYSVDPKVAGAAFQEFVQENGAAALTELHLDGKYLEEFAIDPGAKYNESKYLG